MHIYFFIPILGSPKPRNKFLGGRGRGSVQNHVKPRFSIRYSFLDLSLISQFVTHFLDATLQQILRWNHLKTWWEPSTEFLGGRVLWERWHSIWKQYTVTKIIYLPKQDTIPRYHSKDPTQGVNKTYHIIYINMVKPVKRTQHKKLNKTHTQTIYTAKKSTIARTMNDLTHFQTFCIIKHKATNTDQPDTTTRPPQPAYIVKYASSVSSSLRRKSPTTTLTIP